MITPEMSATRREIVKRSRLASQRQRPPYTLPQQTLSVGDGGGRSYDGAKIEAAYVGYRRDFQGKLAIAKPKYEALFTVVDDDREVNTQIWLNRSPKMRRWVGEKVLHKARAESHTITTNKYEASELVPKYDVINDRFGLYADYVAGLADSYEQAVDELAFSMLIAGIAGTSKGTTYDGQALIDTDHVIRSADVGVSAQQQTNKVTGALSQTTFVTGLQRFNDLVDEWGNPLNLLGGRPLYLVHGPANDHAAKLIVDQVTQATGEQNLYRGRAIDVSDPRITGTEWALIPGGSSAIIIHRKRPPEFLAADNPNDSGIIATGQFIYSVEAEFGAAYGLWPEIVGGPGS